MQRWIELAVTVPVEAADAVNDRLMGLGAPGVIEEEAGPARSRLRLRAHYPDTTDPAALSRSIRSFLRSVDEIFPGCGEAPFELSSVADEDWAEGWKRKFPPVDVGRRLRVRTPWSPPSDGRRLEIRILPAMAFGTGHHASTIGCLLALEELPPPALRSVLDVGTGSGILAIAAARLGARRVLAIDVDPVAVEAAAGNVRENGLDETIAVRAGAIDEVDERFHLIVANLYSGLLRSLMPAFRAISNPQARLLVAGFLDADRDTVASAARSVGWREEWGRSLDGWTTLVFRDP